MTKTKQEILNELHSGILPIKFTKANGEQRIMLATLSEHYIPLPKTENDNTRDNVESESQVVWDVEKSAWRTFRWDRLNDN